MISIDLTPENTACTSLPLGRISWSIRRENSGGGLTELLCSCCIQDLKHYMATLAEFSFNVNWQFQVNLHRPQIAYDTSLLLSDHNFQSRHYSRIVLVRL